MDPLLLVIQKLGEALGTAETAIAELNQIIEDLRNSADPP